jgi:hypothetical protein
VSGEEKPWTPPEEKPLKGVKKSKSEPLATRRELRDMLRAEKGWRAVYLDREAESPRFVRVVAWGRFNRIDDATDDVCGSGVAALVLQQLFEPDDELCFAEDSTAGEFLGMAEPDDDGSFWFDVVKAQLGEEENARHAEELRALKKLTAEDCPEGW